MSNAFKKWFLPIDPKKVKKLNAKSQQDINEEQKEKEKETGGGSLDPDVDKERDKFAALVIDCLSINIHPTINNEYICSLGGKELNKQEYIEKLSKTFSNDIPSNSIAKDYRKKISNSQNDMSKPTHDIGGDSSSSSDENDNVKTTNKNAPNQLEAKMEEEKEKFCQMLEFSITEDTALIKVGFLMQEKHLRAIIDCIKCRMLTSVEQLIKFDFGPNKEYKLCVSDVIALILELCDRDVIKRV